MGGFECLFRTFRTFGAWGGGDVPEGVKVKIKIKIKVTGWKGGRTKWKGQTV